jgi:hypothetical protein
MSPFGTNLTLCSVGTLRGRQPRQFGTFLTQSGLSIHQRTHLATQQMVIFSLVLPILLSRPANIVVILDVVGELIDSHVREASFLEILERLLAAPHGA